MSRIARIVGINLPHHIIHRGNRGEPIFLKEGDRRNYLRLLRESCKYYDILIWAWCLMTNHLHLLLFPRNSEGLAKVMQKVARTHSRNINLREGWTGRLWEARYYSCVVERESYLWAVSRYIETNPVRAKLVSRPEEWFWSSARAHLLGEKNPEIELEPWLNEEERKQYVEFVNEEVLQEEILQIRRSTSSGRPLGREIFITEFGKSLGRRVPLLKRGRPKIKKWR